MARVSSEELRSLSTRSLTDARWNRIHRSASLRERIKELKEELMDVRSELAEIEFLIAQNKQPLSFPAPATTPEPKVLSDAERDRQERINPTTRRKRSA